MYPKIIFAGYVVQDINIFPSRKIILPGGAAYFTAIAASLFTKPVGLVTRIGTDYDPTFLQSRVLKEGLHIVKRGKTGMSEMIYFSENDLTKRDVKVIWGVTKNIHPRDIPKKWHSLPVHVHIATMPPAQQRLFVDFIRKHMKRAIISMDTDIIWLKTAKNKKLVEQNFQKCDIVFSNRIEYDVLRRTVNSVNEAVVKLDKDGAFVLQKGKIVAKTPAKRVKAIDATGAGDIFAGTYLALRSKGKSLSMCLKKAIELATRSVTEEGVDHLFS